jgi:putative ABC transport system permease protein
MKKPDDWRDELDSHLEMRAGWNQAQGATPEQARTEARKQFGSLLRAYEDVRAVHVSLWLDSLRQDVRQAWRGFRRSPVFSLAAVATLAIGIGASTAVFSVVDPLLFRALPYPGGERLVSVGFFGPLDTNEFHLSNSYLDWRDRQTVFESLTSMLPGDTCDLDAATPQRLRCYSVESNFLKTLGVAPLLGRDFTADENRQGVPKVALVSFGLWRSQFGGDPHILGQTMILDEERVQIAGVLPPGFQMPQSGDIDVMLPEQWNERAARAPDSTIVLRTFARLKAGVSIEQAREGLRPLFEDSLRKYVPAQLRSEVLLVVRSLRDRRIHEVKLASWMLLGAVLALLLLACANVANLLLARAAARRTELALRAAIGAGRGRLVRQMLTESVLLGLLGGVAGCAVAWSLVRVFVAVAPDGLLRLDEARIDLRVLLFTLAVSIMSALLFGLAPAFSRPRASALAGWRDAGPPPTLFRKILVAVQVAISLVLLTGASLFARSLQKLETQSLGFRPERLVTASFTLRRQRYRTPQARMAFYRELEQRLERIPGGGVFALSDSIPPRGSMGRPYSNIRIAGHPALQPNGGMVDFRYVTPGYFQAMGIRIASGRAFEPAERLSGEPPLILSATLARRMFPNENPVGQQVDLDGTGGWGTVVGVAEDAKNNGLSGPADPEYYRLRMDDSMQLGRSGVALFRTSLDPGVLSQWIRQEMAAADPSLPVTIAKMETRVDAFTDQPRLVAMLVGLFALFGLTLAVVGLYGVMSFLVAQRTREIGVRMAIGATPGDIAALIQKHALLWTAGGIGAGLLGSMILTRLVRGLLFEVSPQDPISLATAAVVVAIAASLAWIPSHRAARVDPAAALRNN